MDRAHLESPLLARAHPRSRARARCGAYGARGCLSARRVSLDRGDRGARNWRNKAHDRAHVFIARGQRHRRRRLAARRDERDHTYRGFAEACRWLQSPPALASALYIDGQELVPCQQASPSPSCISAVAWLGKSAGFYSTREESYERIRYTGGVSPWTVSSPSGSKRTYTTLDGGQTWLLARREDRHGNRIEYAYGCPVGYECALETIRYGGVGAVAGAEVRFYYETRPDVTTRATGTGFAIQDKRLRSIVVTFAGQLIRAYAFGYQPSQVSGRSLLRSIQQFGRDATVDTAGDRGRITAGPTPPLPATTFAMESQAGARGWRFNTVVDRPNLLSTSAASTTIPRHYLKTEVPGGDFWLDVAQDSEYLLPRQLIMVIGMGTVGPIWRPFT